MNKKWKQVEPEFYAVRIRIAIFALLLLPFLLTSGLHRNAGAQEEPADTIYLPILQHGATGSPSTAAFTVGVEYGIPGLAETYAASGVTSVKLRPEFGKWGNIEFTQGERNWETLDLLVTEYQSAGFTQVQIVLMADSPWASIAPTTSGIFAEKNTFPKPEYVDDYETFVTAVVERYDADGTDDMPGLLYPVHDYAVEAEFSGFWPGSADDYVDLLQIAYPAIHAANPQAVVALVAILAVDVFDGAPAADEVDRRFERSFSGRKERVEIEQILDACDYYDVVDFHSLGDYTEIPVTARWLQQELDERECAKPLLIGDSFSMSMLTGYVFSTFHPTNSQQRAGTVSWLQAVADPEDTHHDMATSWLRGEMARSLVRKIVSAAGSDVVGINIGNFEDWTTGVVSLDEALVPSIGASAFMGMIDRTRTDEYAGGPLPYTQAEFSRINEPGESRPALHALALVQQKVNGFVSVTKLDLDENVWGYRFERADGPLWVLWYDEGTLILPDETAPETTVTIDFPTNAALVSTTPTEIGQSGTITATIPVTNAKLTLTVSVAPLFVELIDSETNQ